MYIKKAVPSFIGKLKSDGMWLLAKDVRESLLRNHTLRVCKVWRRGEVRLRRYCCVGSLSAGPSFAFFLWRVDSVHLSPSSPYIHRCGRR